MSPSPQRGRVCSSSFPRSHLSGEGLHSPRATPKDVDSPTFLVLQGSSHSHLGQVVTVQVSQGGQGWPKMAQGVTWGTPKLPRGMQGILANYSIMGVTLVTPVPWTSDWGNPGPHLEVTLHHPCPIDLGS